MPFYYLSFCDVNRPDGQKHLGATVVQASDREAAIKRTSELGINPGGEIMIGEVPDVPPEGMKYFEQFVSHAEMIADGEKPIGELDEDMLDIVECHTDMICQKHNPVQ